MMEKKRVLIYGDSNTHGFRVSDGLRYGPHQRWTGVCQDMVTDSIEILEEGLNGRTTCFREPFMEFRNGLDYIQPCVRTHAPLDMICVMLGSNDLKKEFHQEAPGIARNAARVLDRAKRVLLSKYPDSVCKYVLMSPVEITEDLAAGPFGFEFDGLRAAEQSRLFAKYFKSEAERHGFLFFDAAAVAKPGRVDGLHLDEENHRKLGEAFSRWLLENL